MIRRTWLGVVLPLLCAGLLAGCQNKYEEIYLPTVETAQADIVPETEEETQGEPEGDVQSSSSEVQTVTQPPADLKDTDETVYVTGSGVNLRAGASTEARVITALDKGQELKRTGYGEKWSRVIYKGQECYISSKYVSKEKPKGETAPAVSSVGKGKTVAIDAGHQARGNSEKEPDGPGSSTMKAKVASGATGVSTGLAEYQLTLSVSKKLKAELEARGYQVVMIRDKNEVNISNAERAKAANESGADVFLRIHGNSLNDQSVHGALTMCQTSKNPYNGGLYSKSAALSKSVVDGLCKATGAKNRGVQETDTMSGINWCTIPVTIVEMGFMSNPKEDKNMASEDYQALLAKGIADGVDHYYASGSS